MKILVTGGAGFIGSNLVDALILGGHQVAVIDNLSTGNKANLNPAAEFFKIDINDKFLTDVFTSVKPEIVFHLAAQIDVRKSVADPVWDAQQNILGSINLLENCKKSQVKKVIFSSSGGAIYGDTDKIPTAENHLELPISPYGIAKLAIEKYLNYYHQVFGLPYIALRYSNVYGPRQNAKGEAGVVAIFCDKLLLNQSPIINGTGEQTRDYVYVGDVVKANLAAFKSDKVGIYNIGTGVETDVNQLVKEIMENLKINVDFSHGPANVGEQLRSCLDWQKAKKDLDWRPEVGLEQGIRETVNWFNKKISN